MAAADPSSCGFEDVKRHWMLIPLLSLPPVHSIRCAELLAPALHSSRNNVDAQANVMRTNEI